MDDVTLDEERRAGERRFVNSRVEFRIELLETRVQALISTMDSRHKALDRGQDLILDRLRTLEDIKSKAEGAVWLARLLGITGVIGGIVAIVRMVKG